MNGKRRAVDRIIPFHNFASVIDQNQVGGRDGMKGNAERVDPKMIGPFRVTNGDVPGDSFGKTEFAKDSKATSKFAFQVGTVFNGIVKFRRARDSAENFTRWIGYSHDLTVFDTSYVS